MINDYSQYIIYLSLSLSFIITISNMRILMFMVLRYMRATDPAKTQLMFEEALEDLGEVLV